MKSSILFFFIFFSVLSPSQVGNNSFSADDFETNSAFGRSSNSSIQQEYVFDGPGNVGDPVEMPGNPGEPIEGGNDPGNPGDPVPIDEHLPVLMVIGILLLIFFSFRFRETK